MHHVLQHPVIVDGLEILPFLLGKAAVRHAAFFPLVKERRAAQRRCVQKLALLVADGGLNDGDDFRRRLRPEFPFWVFQVPEVPLAGQPDILAGADRSAEYALHIAVHGRLEV